eukprot:4458985-Amphidinium_carterae.1
MQQAPCLSNCGVGLLAEIWCYCPLASEELRAFTSCWGQHLTWGRCGRSQAKTFTMGVLTPWVL